MTAQALFSPSDAARLFYVPPGCDYGAALLGGLFERLSGAPPDALARVEILANTRRLERRLTQLLQDHGPLLLPRIRLLTDLANDPAAGPLAPQLSPLRRRLMLRQLVVRLLKSRPGLAPQSAAYDLADSLAGLLDEMHGEGVSLSDLKTLTPDDLARHWEDSYTFLCLLGDFLDNLAGGLDPEARQARAVDRLISTWKTSPPQNPVLLVGSTGSRGTTRRLMKAVATLPQGALVLPGFDTDMTAQAWDRLDDARTGEDHPQFRYATLLRELGRQFSDVEAWAPDARICNAERNRVVSLALRPAPVTDQWRSEAAGLGDISTAFASVTYIAAPDPRSEATAIALRMRQAVDEGKSVALVTPDRVLSRRVAAALDRWRIVPDDSAGRPLALSAPGRLLRAMADLRSEPPSLVSVISALKHPLVAAGDQRGQHLLHLRDLELHLRSAGQTHLSAEGLLDWGKSQNTNDVLRWSEWVIRVVLNVEPPKDQALQKLIEEHKNLCEEAVSGPAKGSSAPLWDEAAGREAARVMSDLLDASDAGGHMHPRDYASLIGSILSATEVRDPVRPHPGVAIWGTLEARVQSADLVILGGLNDGTWPKQPTPDPWLSRPMRRQAGLLLPERQLGLSAHDFQHAVAAQEVVLTRATRDDEVETVPSRWLNRLTNLLSGLPGQGSATLEAMRQRGDRLLQDAARLDLLEGPLPAAKRPAPIPPLEHRPKQLSVTRIATLIRDPYAIYAERILRLKPLPPLQPDFDARLRGILVHRILEKLIQRTKDVFRETAETLFREITEDILSEAVPSQAMRAIWSARLQRLAPEFVAAEQKRRSSGAPLALEAKGTITLSGGFSLTGTADRIDRLDDGSYAVLDYKTGQVPSKKQMQLYDKQLYLEAAMLERGGFPDVPVGPVSEIAYLGLGTSYDQKVQPLDGETVGEIWEQFETLLAKFEDPSMGYSARRAMFRRDDSSDFDHLARYLEWDLSDAPEPEQVG